MTCTPDKIRRPVLRYHGGKYILAPWIVDHMPPHKVYVEPFGGGGSVLMQKPRSYAEIYNDKWGRVVDVFKVLRDKKKARELERRLYLTPFSRDEFMDTDRNPRCMIERARLTIFRSYAGFGSASSNGENATGFRANSNRSGSTPAHDWANFPHEISTFVERLRGVVIENRDASVLVERFDSAETLFYVDPPYPHSTRNMRRGNSKYAHELTDDDHRALATQLRAVEGMVILSGYPSELYDVELYRDWERVERETMAQGAKKRIEVLWFNRAATVAKERAAMPLFGDTAQ